MTNPSAVKFVSFNTDKQSYQKPVSNITEVINFVGQIFKGWFEGFQVFIVVTLSDGTPQQLAAFPTYAGYFEIGFPLDKNTQAGICKAQAKYMQATSNEISFQVS